MVFLDGRNWSWDGLNQKRILIVDDTKMVRDITKTMLESAGYSVVVAECGFDAIKALKEDRSIEAVLLDYAMPIMDGIETYHEIHRLFPQLPVVLISGYRLENLSMRLSGNEPDGFLQKPYGVDALLEKVQEVLEVHDSRKAQ